MAATETQSLEQRLRAVEAAKTGSYEKRTEHINDAGETTFINRLILQDSPYLLQHAHNPVNWHAWGAEPFQIAREENKPVFLSIGYSTCHWCHVMEVESFDNVDVAALLNRHFVSIKMDREQYPDIDEIYMTGVQLMTGHGGWPMSNFLLPDGRPFFAATYFRPEQFLQLLGQIVDAWEQKYSELETSAASIHSAIGRLLNANKGAQALDTNAYSNCMQALRQRDDINHGGLAGAPKFPQEPILLLALDQAVHEGDAWALDFVNRALDAMARGGICDQVGGGFHRYSVDENWLVPHFEKMLYNQSQLGLLYCDMYRLTGNDFFQRTLSRTLDYVVREMQLQEGGFYSATDADSEGSEGTFFLWTPAQIGVVLEHTDVELIIDCFGISRAGNFEGANIPHFGDSIAELEQRHGIDVLARLDVLLTRLYQEREQRIHPLRDDKLIVAWSAAMATTLARAGHALDRADWLQSAEAAIDLMLARNAKEPGLLWRIYLNDQVSVAAQLEDYANLIQALLALYKITGDMQRLTAACQLMDVVVAEFHDAESGLFYLSPKQQSGPQLVRSSTASDGATISAVATLLENLWNLENLSALLEDRAAGTNYRQLRQRCLSALAAEVNENALSHCSLLRVFRLSEEGSREAIQYAADGLVRAEIRKTLTAEQAAVQVFLSCAKEWHLVANTADTDTADLLPVTVSVGANETNWQIASIDYPLAKETMPQPGKDVPVPIYADDVTITVQLQRTGGEDGFSQSINLEIELQACGEEHCLLPQTLRFLI